MDNIGAFVGEVLRVEKITSANEEYRHMEDEQKMIEPSRHSCMRKYHKDDGYCLQYGKTGFTHKGSCNFVCLHFSEDATDGWGHPRERRA